MTGVAKYSSGPLVALSRDQQDTCIASYPYYVGPFLGWRMQVEVYSDLHKESKHVDSVLG